MTVGEKRAWFILMGFVGVTLICLVLLILGADKLGWEVKHLYLACLSLTAVAHVFWLVPYVFSRRKEERTAVAVDERDLSIFDRANAIAARMCCGVFFVGAMLFGVVGIYTGDGRIDAPAMFLLVLCGSLAFMLAQSIATVVL
ncbi:MAG: hypothetical protein JSU74_07585, partial [Candidatus Zixiibacteriota bacterium]